MPSQPDYKELMRSALLELREYKARVRSLEQERNEPIAIIGVGCRFPGGADDPEAFWRLLRDGVDAVGEVPEGRWDVSAYFSPDPHEPGKMLTRNGAFLSRIDEFDAEFFGISPREAITMDPQQRLLLEVAWEAFENAGIAADRLAGSSTGVYVGLMNNDYAHRQVNELELVDIDPHMLTGNSISFPAGRLSYVFGLQGPSMVVATACSSSLVTVHLAAQALRHRECDLALAGGSNVIASPFTSIILSKMNALSPSGRCKTFDASADGYGRGEGCGVVVLKRFSDAVADGDRIQALIRGSAVNHDGTSAGLTAPNGSAQVALIRKALDAARVDPEALQYVEAHGTGTALGDPIEIHSLLQALGTNRDQPILIGSVKTNIGHLEAAAGVAGLIKVVLAMQHQQIPRQLHFHDPNPRVDWENIPVQVADRLVDWPRTEQPRLAGISSFGLSGINAHMIVEEAPLLASEEPADPRPSIRVLSLSARTANALEQLRDRYVAHLTEQGELAWEAVCRTAGTGRMHHDHRMAVVSDSLSAACEALDDARPSQADPSRIAFLFTGQGSQSVGMGSQLYRYLPVFREAFDRCDEILRPHVGISLGEIIYSPNREDSRVHQTAFTQPALFALEYSLVSLWKSWGVEPDVVMGHSVGEYAAACVAGVFTLEEGAELIALRGKLMQQLPPGGEMMAVFAPYDRVRDLIAPESRYISMAADNGPEEVVISGERDAMGRVLDILAMEGVRSTQLTVSHAFHSPLMEPMKGAFEEVARGIDYSKPRIDWVSTVTGESMAGTVVDSSYWRDQIRRTVRFLPGMTCLEKLEIGIFVEVGPRPTLLGLGRKSLAGRGSWLPSLRPDRDLQQLLEAVGKLYELGVDIDWDAVSSAMDGKRAGRVVLPTYPFERRRYWVLDRDKPFNPMPQTSRTVTPEHGKIRNEVLGARAEDRLELLATHLGKRCAGILGLPETPAVAHRSLLQIGFDSLMVVELNTWITREFVVDLGVEDLLTAANISSIAEKVEQGLEHAPPSVVEPVSGAAITQQAAGGEPFALSHGQQALWFIHKNAPESSAYNVGVALRVLSHIDSARLERAWKVLTVRHPALRTTFSEVGGVPMQVVNARAEVPFERIDATVWKMSSVEERIKQAYRKPFDLGRGSARATLLSLAGQQHILLITIHHMVCDGRSVQTLLDELQVLLETGSEQSLEALDVDYADFVAWQDRMLAAPDAKRLVSYWMGKLSGELPVSNLPTDRPRPPLQSFEGSTYRFELDTALIGRIRHLAAENKATLFMALLTAFKVLLHRCSDETDIIVGTPALGRSQSRFADTVGYFINPIPLRTDLSGDPTFTKLIGAVRETVIRGLEHQDLPFRRLVELLGPRRDPSRSPLFQIDFSMRKETSASPTLESFPLAEEEGQFDLGMHLVETEQSTRVALKYRTDLFDAATIRRMAGHYERLLQSIVADPNLSISRIGLLNDTERRQLIEWSHGAPMQDVHSVHWRFSDQVFRTPDAIALSTGDLHLTYEELSRQVHHLAHRLRTLGVRPGSRVGICMHRSAELVISILAVLQSGGAYVPLDPTYPSQRLSFMLSDAQANILLTEETLRDKVPAQTIIFVDTLPDSPVLAQELEDLVMPGDAAYVIYTSGSTGQPKGVEVSHAALASYLEWAVQAYGASEGIGAPLHMSIGFDATVTALFSPLLVGRTLFIQTEADDMEALLAAVRSRSDYSLIKLTPAHLEVLAQQLDPKRMAGLTRTLVVGGETLSASTLIGWKQHAPETRIINEYGPTEATVGCCVHEVGPNPSGNIPIGRPISGARLYVVDRHMELVPVGVAGELCIGGAGIARGYVNRPELTEERFLDDPFSEASEARLYRSGDLARYRSDGELEFLGRVDDQLKIRGYRIEPGEVQAALAEHQGVKEALVIARKQQTGDQQLMGYYTIEEAPLGSAPRQEDLERQLRSRLPEYMVPSRLIELDHFPLTANGKIDRVALPDPGTRSEVTAPPRDGLEMELVLLWEHLLEVHPIGVTDDFFALGGHSLLALRLVAKLEEKFGGNLPLAALLASPTVAGLADFLRNEQEPATDPTLVAMQSEGDLPPFFCVPGAGGNVIYLHQLARRLGRNQPFYGLQAVGLDGRIPPHKSVEEMASHNVEVIERAKYGPPYMLGGHSLGGWVAFEMALQLEARGHKVGAVVVLDTPAPEAGMGQDTSAWDQARWIVEFSDRVRHLLREDLQIDVQVLEDLSPDQQLAYLVTELDRIHLLSSAEGLEEVERILQVFMAHSQLSYGPASPLAAPILLLRTESHDPEWPQTIIDDRHWGWDAHGSVTSEIVPGTHLTMLAEPFVEELARRLSAGLAEASVSAPRTASGQLASGGRMT